MDQGRHVGDKFARGHRVPTQRGRDRLPSDLAGLSIPTLILLGDADASAPLQATGERTAALVPGAQLIVYSGAPHAVSLTHRDRVSADLLAFVGAKSTRPWREAPATNPDRADLAAAN